MLNMDGRWWHGRIRLYCFYMPCGPCMDPRAYTGIVCRNFWEFNWGQGTYVLKLGHFEASKMVKIGENGPKWAKIGRFLAIFWPFFGKKSLKTLKGGRRGIRPSNYQPLGILWRCARFHTRRARPGGAVDIFQIWLRYIGGTLSDFTGFYIFWTL